MITVICAYCQIEFLRYRSQAKAKNKFCSKNCKKEWSKTNLTGKNNPNYRYGQEESKCICGKFKDYRAKLCAICAHISYPKDVSSKTSIETVKEAIKTSTSILDTSRKLSISRKTISTIIKENNINIDHFKAGMGRPSREDQIFNITDRRRNNTVKEYILKNKIFAYICSECSQNNIWNNKELTLELDHINGNPFDNNLENLRFLCPNCHSQTPTNKGKNSKNAKKKRSMRVEEE